MPHAKTAKKKRLNAEAQIKAAGIKKPQKFPVGSIEARTYNGVVYRSVLERKFAQWFDFRLRKKCLRCYGGTIEHSTKICPHCKGIGFIGGDVLSWERQVKFDLLAYKPIHYKLSPFYGGKEHTSNSKKKIGTYKIDFVVHYVDGIVDGDTEYLEVKGYNAEQKKHPTLTPESKLKIAIFKANNPKLKFRIVDERNLEGF